MRERLCVGLCVVWAVVLGGCQLGDDAGELPVLRYTSPNNAYVGQEVIFDASASFDAEGPIAWYTFEFGDGDRGVRGRSPVASHTYNAPGEYVARVTVVDERGNKSTELRTMVIVERDPSVFLTCREARPYCPPYYACEVAEERCYPDRDGDGVWDAIDVCPDIPDADQGDEDNDGTGDVCEGLLLGRERGACSDDASCGEGSACIDGLCRPL